MGVSAVLATIAGVAGFLFGGGRFGPIAGQYPPGWADRFAAVAAAHLTSYAVGFAGGVGLCGWVAWRRVGHASRLPGQPGRSPHTSLSLVIPALNESAALPATLDRAFALDPPAHEIIVADGGSADDTRAIAAARGARVVTSEAGRARQMNAGGRRGDRRPAGLPARGHRAPAGPGRPRPHRPGRPGHGAGRLHRGAVWAGGRLAADHAAPPAEDLLRPGVLPPAPLPVRRPATAVRRPVDLLPGGGLPVRRRLRRRVAGDGGGPTCACGSTVWPRPPVAPRGEDQRPPRAGVGSRAVEPHVRALSLAWAYGAPPRWLSRWYPDVR